MSLIVAFSSLAYEFILAQTLAAIFGGTLFCYALVIGVFTLSLGLGALTIKGDSQLQPLQRLIKIEWLLSFLGAISPLGLLFFDPVLWPDWPRWLVWILALVPVFLIGWFSGQELPLLQNQSEQPEIKLKILSADYWGMFLVSILFALVFLPRLGLLTTALLISALNILVGWWLLWQLKTRRWIMAYGLLSFFILLSFIRHNDLFNWASQKFSQGGW